MAASLTIIRENGRVFGAACAVSVLVFELSAIPESLESLRLGTLFQDQNVSRSFHLVCKGMIVVHLEYLFANWVLDPQNRGVPPLSFLRRGRAPGQMAVTEISAGTIWVPTLRASYSGNHSLVIVLGAPIEIDGRFHGEQWMTIRQNIPEHQLRQAFRKSLFLKW